MPHTIDKKKNDDGTFDCSIIMSNKLLQVTAETKKKSATATFVIPNEFAEMLLKQYGQGIFSPIIVRGLEFRFREHPEPEPGGGKE